ncbi:MAG: cytochrome C oxidase subunit I [Burkholderiaceae bacterium]|nr:cytochrome C oxidase subunit I [Burkholderiaceae bacterium]
MTDSTVSQHEARQRRAGDERAPLPRPRKRAAGRLKLLALLLLLASPIAASYYTYYVLRPDGRTNYGTLIEQRPVDSLGGAPVVGDVRTLGELRGRWVMLVVAPSDCDEDCRLRLYHVRQVRLTAGKERDRVVRVWLLPDAGMPDPALLAEHEGLLVIRVPGQQIATKLPATATTSVSDHIWLIDPMGHLMMRFPRDADPSRIKKDLAKVLRASGIG